jgi:hypothetical protein
MSVTHAKVTGEPALGSALIDGHDWDAAHLLPSEWVVWFFQNTTIAGGWSDMQAGVYELFDSGPAGGDKSQSNRSSADLTYAAECSLHVRVEVTGAAGATLLLQYSTNGGSTWSTLCSVPIDSTGNKIAAWVALPGAAQAEVLLRAAGQGGDGVADPNLNGIFGRFR